MILNGEPLEEVDCFKYPGSQVAADGGCERDVVHRMNEGYRAGVLNQGGIPPLWWNGRAPGGMEGPEKVILICKKLEFKYFFVCFVAFHIQLFNGYCIIYGTYRNLSYNN